MSEGGKDLSRRDLLKLFGIGTAALAAKPILDIIPTETAYGEIIKVGDLKVHLLPFDHVEGAAGVPKAKAAYEVIETAYPNAIPLVEYFPPEIERETDYRPLKLGQKYNPGNEFETICASYGTLIDESSVNHILVADPAYNYLFAVPEVAPYVAGMGAAIVGGAEVGKAAKFLNRRQFLKVAVGGMVGVGAMGLGITTMMGSDENVTNRIIKSAKNSNLPTVIGEADFRILTVVRALEQLGKATNTIQTKDVILIYPPAHIDKMRAILSQGSENWIQTNIKFDIYKTMYSALNLTNIREWERTGDDWQKIKKIPIKFSI